MTHTQANDGPRLLLAALCRGKVELRTDLFGDLWPSGQRRTIEDINTSVVVRIHGIGSHFVLPLTDDGTPILGEGLTQTLVKLMEDHNERVAE